MGIEENLLTAEILLLADKVLIVYNIDIEQPSRFDAAKTVFIPMEEVLLSVDKVFIKHSC